MEDALLKVSGLVTEFSSQDGVVRAVDGVSFSVGRGETVAIVGESGCGKSVTALSIMRLIPSPPGKITEGAVFFEGHDVLEKTEADMRRIRGNDMAMIFQEPMTSLNPILTIGYQVMEAIMLHQGASRVEARGKAINMLRLVGIPSPERRMDDYPHHMSGGMRQRVMIAMALSCHPKLLIADEPTTALDVTTQAQILELMMELREDFRTSIILITHDLGIVAESADKVAVMYAGKIVESADTIRLFQSPMHPYTAGLLGSLPKLHEDRERLHVIDGVVPSPYSLPEGCRFHPRCGFSENICRTMEPGLMEHAPNHQVGCWKLVDYQMN